MFPSLNYTHTVLGFKHNLKQGNPNFKLVYALHSSRTHFKYTKSKNKLTDSKLTLWFHFGSSVVYFI